MWIQLIRPCQIDLNGQLRRYSPGDWVNVGKMLANKLIGEGSASAVGKNTITERTDLPATSWGIVIKGKLPDVEILETIPNDQQATGEPRLPWDYTVIWDTGANKARTELIPTGLTLVEKWEIAVPLYDYKVLACHIGTEEERDLTKDAIRDLRVPFYDIRFMFVHRTPDTIRLFTQWEQEQGNRYLAFLRAIYQVKPLVLALPATWAGWNYAR